MSDSDIDEDANIECVINHVEKCIQLLEAAEEAAHVKFKAPKSNELERTELWARHLITERYPIEQLEGLLASLTTEKRDVRWFKWLKWVLFESAQN